MNVHPKSARNAIAALMLAALTAASAPSAAREPAGDAPLAASSLLPAAGLRRDVAILRSALEHLHPGLYRYATHAAMDARFDALARDLSHDTSLGDVYLRLSRFTASIRCGHTYLNLLNQPSAVREALLHAPRLPFAFRWLDGTMVVTRDLTPTHAIPAGSIVHAVDSTPTAAILRTLLPYVRGDGANDAKRIDLLSDRGTERYETADAFVPLLFPGWTTPYRLDVERPDGTRGRIDVAARIPAARRTSDPTIDAAASRNAPLFTARTLANGTVLLTMPTWAVYVSTWDWRTWLDGVLDDAVAANAPMLAIDIRGNEGGVGSVGDALLARILDARDAATNDEHLVRYRTVPADLRPYLETYDRSVFAWGDRVAERAAPVASAPHERFFRRTDADDDTPSAAPRPRFRGAIVVLTDAANSSATFAFARAIRRAHRGLLLGEPTGGNLRGTNGGSFLFLTLPTTRLEIDIPLVGTFPRSNEPDAGLVPDSRVTPTAADIAAGIDPVLAKLGTLGDGR